MFRFGYGTEERKKHVLHTGDSDRAAWETHILGEDDYHADRLPSAVLNASHHGANTFFYDADPADQEAYERHIKLIDPTWVIISSPRQKDSPHGHPKDEAVALYKKHVRVKVAANVITLGEKKSARIYDVYADVAARCMDTDDGELAVLFPPLATTMMTAVAERAWSREIDGRQGWGARQR